MDRFLDKLWLEKPFYMKIREYSKTLGPYHSKFTDKVAVKGLIKDSSLLKTAKLIKVLKNPTDLSKDDLNPYHILKARHGCGLNVDLATIQPDQIPEIIEFMKQNNKKYIINQYEQHYKHIEPGFFIEEKVNDLYNGVSSKAAVFMFRCIHGKPISIGIKMSNDSVNYLYTPDWKQLTEFKSELDKPRDYDIMLKVCDTYAKQFPFVRLDLYQGNDGVYLSEFTFTPSGGNKVFSTAIEKQMGSFWKTRVDV